MILDIIRKRKAEGLPAKIIAVGEDDEYYSFHKSVHFINKEGIFNIDQTGSPLCACHALGYLAGSFKLPGGDYYYFHAVRVALTKKEV